uniref:Uncharacterized protein n=1 Tax=Gadus morhua TaxID=8049 RepID=A0A8C5B313_GADMO
MLVQDNFPMIEVSIPSLKREVDESGKSTKNLILFTARWQNMHFQRTGKITIIIRRRKFPSRCSSRLFLNPSLSTLSGVPACRTITVNNTKCWAKPVMLSW